MPCIKSSTPWSRALSKGFGHNILFYSLYCLSYIYKVVFFRLRSSFVLTFTEWNRASWAKGVVGLTPLKILCAWCHLQLLTLAPCAYSLLFAFSSSSSPSLSSSSSFADTTFLLRFRFLSSWVFLTFFYSINPSFAQYRYSCYVQVEKENITCLTLVLE